MAGRKTTLAIRKVQDSPAAPPLEKFTTEAAFSTFTMLDAMPGETEGERDLRQEHWDAERGIRAIAMLLDSASGHGNEPVNAMEAVGLASLLEDYADRVAHLQRSGARLRAEASASQAV